MRPGGHGGDPERSRKPDSSGTRWFGPDRISTGALDDRNGVPADEEALTRAAEALERGELLAHPTSTVYGLGGRPRPEIEAAVARLKRRPRAPLIRLVRDAAVLPGVIPEAEWSDDAERLAEAFWPGPLTLVLDDGSEDGVAVRVDAHPVIAALLDRAGGALTSTSLNLAGQPPARTRAAAARYLSEMAAGGGRLGWLDAGDLDSSEASTLYSLRRGRRGLLREGAIVASRVSAVLERDAEGAK